MKIAVPVAEGELAVHFGQCRSFVLVEVDGEGRIVSVEERVPPPHEPGVLPAWLADAGVDTVIAGGMGRRAVNLFAARGIRVVVGAPRKDPRAVVEDYVAGTLETGENVCDH